METKRYNSFIDDPDARNAVLAAIIESSDDAIISKNLDGIIISWNKSAERMFGYTEDEVIGKHISIIIPEDRLAEEDMIISSLRAGRRVEHYQTIRRAKSGRFLHIAITVSPVRNNNGTIVGASKIARDISRQVELEEISRRYTRHLELINDSGKELAAELDVDLILQKATDVTTKLSGAAFGAFFYNRVDEKGEAYMLYALSGAPREAFDKFGMPRNTAVFDMTFSGKGVLRSDNIQKDPRYGKNAPNSGMPPGHLPVVSYLAVPVFSQPGNVIGGLFFGHPEAAMFKEEHEALVLAIAAQAGVALDKARLYEEIRALNAKKDEFIGFASHELKTPITTISGYLQIAEQHPEMSAEILPKINRQVTRLSAIVSDLLDISKIHSGGIDFKYDRTNLNRIIKEAIEGVKPLAQKHKVEYSLPSENIEVTVDAQKIIQVLVNVLTNAIKYSQANTSVKLAAQLFGDEIRIAVTDQGPGIARHHLDMIFNRFYRVRHTGNRPEGMGLGLYISKEIMEGHRGKIWAESEEGKGSTFHVVFPVDASGKG